MQSFLGFHHNLQRCLGDLTKFLNNASDKNYYSNSTETAMLNFLSTGIYNIYNAHRKATNQVKVKCKITFRGILNLSNQIVINFIPKLIPEVYKCK